MAVSAHRSGEPQIDNPLHVSGFTALLRAAFQQGTVGKLVFQVFYDGQ